MYYLIKKATKTISILIITLSLGGCSLEDLFSNLMSDINSSMENSGAEGETFDISALQFEPGDCDDPWFCESKVRERVFKGVAKGVTYVANKRSNVTWVNRVKTGEAGGFYEKLSSIETESGRQSFLNEFAKSHNSTVIIFGRYWGDDYEMVLKPYMYYSNRGTLAKAASPSKYTRSMPEDELIEKIARTIRDMLVQTLDG